jgi:hypothetical protein
MWKISVFFIVVAGLATFFMTSSAYQNASQSKQQRTFFDDAGKLHVMGIVLGKSTLRDAEKAFRSRADAAIFLYPLHTEVNGEPQYDGILEAYFPSIADHSKVLLKMAVEPEDLEAMRQRSSKPRMYPNGVIRMNLSNADILVIQKMTIAEVTLMPSVQLDESIVHAQFGQPESTHEVDEVTTYNFPKIGLTAVVNASGKDKLIFANP